MKATIAYRISYEPHPYDKKQRAQGVKAWSLVRVTTPEAGPRTEDVVAIFNFDTEGEAFMGHVFAEGLDGRLVTIDPEWSELFEGRQKRAASKGGR